jgi:hypothetical protein
MFLETKKRWNYSDIASAINSEAMALQSDEIPEGRKDNYTQGLFGYTILHFFELNTLLYHTLELLQLGLVLHYGVGVDSASNRNEYHEYLIGGEKVAGG